MAREFQVKTGHGETLDLDIWFQWRRSGSWVLEFSDGTTTGCLPAADDIRASLEWHHINPQDAREIAYRFDWARPA